MSGADEFLAEWGLISDQQASDLAGVALCDFLRLERECGFPGSFHVGHSVNGRGEVEVLCWTLRHPDLCDLSTGAAIDLLRPHGLIVSRQLPECARGLTVDEISKAQRLSISRCAMY